MGNPGLQARGGCAFLTSQDYKDSESLCKIVWQNFWSTKQSEGLAPGAGQYSGSTHQLHLPGRRQGAAEGGQISSWAWGGQSAKPILDCKVSEGNHGKKHLCALTRKTCPKAGPQKLSMVLKGGKDREQQERSPAPGCRLPTPLGCCASPRACLLKGALCWCGIFCLVQIRAKRCLWD